MARIKLPTPVAIGEDREVHNGLDVITFGFSWSWSLAMGNLGRLARGHLVPTTRCVSVTIQVGVLFSHVEPAGRTAA